MSDTYYCSSKVVHGASLANYYNTPGDRLLVTVDNDRNPVSVYGAPPDNRSFLGISCGAENNKTCTINFIGTFRKAVSLEIACLSETSVGLNADWWQSGMPLSAELVHGLVDTAALFLGVRRHDTTSGQTRHIIRAMERSGKTPENAELAAALGRFQIKKVDEHGTETIFVSGENVDPEYVNYAYNLLTASTIETRLIKKASQLAVREYVSSPNDEPGGVRDSPFNVDLRRQGQDKIGFEVGHLNLLLRSELKRQTWYGQMRPGRQFLENIGKQAVQKIGVSYARYYLLIQEICCEKLRRPELQHLISWFMAMGGALRPHHTSLDRSPVPAVPPHIQSRHRLVEPPQ